MTLVASLTPNNFPLLIGDFLLSGNEVLNRSLIVPTMGNVNAAFPQGSGFVPTALIQKTVVISENFVIGWAGLRIAAKVVIKELIEINEKLPFTINSLKHYLEGIDKIVWKQGLSFVGFIKDSTEDPKIYPFSFPQTPEITIENYGNVRIIGSGSDFLINVIKNTEAPALIQTKYNVLEYAISLGLQISSKLLSDEIVSFESLLNYFGGGYEIISFFNNRFEKLDDVTFLFWYKDKTADIQNWGYLFHICKYTYSNDVLLIRISRHCNWSGEYQKNEFKDSLYFVNPIYREATEKEIESFIVPSFNSKFICNCFVSKSDCGKFLITNSVTNFIDTNNPIISFSEFDDLSESTKISFNTEWAKSILEGLR